MKMTIAFALALPSLALSLPAIAADATAAAPVVATEQMEELHKSFEALMRWDGFEMWMGVYLVCGLSASLLIARFIRWLIESYLHRKFASKGFTELDEHFCNALGRPASLLAFVLGAYVSSLPVIESMPKGLPALFDKLFIVAGAIAVAWSAYRFSDLLEFALTKLSARTGNNFDKLIFGVVRKIAKICVIFVAVVFIGQNLGLNITALLAGAGVAGLAIAFAAQDTIANFFGSLMIIIDRPFTVGDYVKIDSVEGNVERVGLRSSSIRTPGGSLITIPNKNAANASIENVTARPFIKRIADYGLVYDTSPEQIENALAILKGIFENHEGMTLDLPPKIYFTEFKDSSLNIQVITWYHPGDFFKHLDWCHRTNMEVLRKFNASSLEFAFPTSTTYIAGDPKRKVLASLATEKQ